MCGRYSLTTPVEEQSGWLALNRMTVSVLETEDELNFAAVTNSGVARDEDQCRRL